MYAACALSSTSDLDDEFWNEDEDRFLWWAKVDETIVGFAQTELTPDPVWTRLSYIKGLYIAPAFRRQGHGRAFAAAIYNGLLNEESST